MVKVPFFVWTVWKAQQMARDMTKEIGRDSRSNAQCDDQIREECGVFGIWGGTDTSASGILYQGLLSLQHRGQESAGITVCDTTGPIGNIAHHKGMGLVSEVFHEKQMEELRGNIGIGHVRYSTAGASSVANTGQAVVMTYPLIGNYGMNGDDYESLTPTISGLIVRDYNDFPSNFRSQETLAAVMERFGIAGITDVDTRQITRHIREIGSCKAMITRESTQTLPRDAALIELGKTELPRDVVAKVSTSTIYTAGDRQKAGYHVVAIDCGMKKNIVNMLVEEGCFVTVVPWNTPDQDIMAYAPDGIFISNGPGDPTDVPRTIETIRNLRGQVPIFGICLGHQIISLAYGAKTYKLKFGHRGGNHPVKNLGTGKIEITSQNHSYAVDAASVEGTGLEITHINLLDQTVEGVQCEREYVCSVQYHPESCPGPQDSAYLFDEFIRLMDLHREHREEASDAETK